MAQKLMNPKSQQQQKHFLVKNIFLAQKLRNGKVLRFQKKKKKVDNNLLKNCNLSFKCLALLYDLTINFNRRKRTRTRMERGEG